MKNREDSILIAKIQDMLQRWRNDYTIEVSQFLDMHQRSIVENFLIAENKGKTSENNEKIDYQFFGGYDDAERVRCYLMQDYANLSENYELCVLKISYSNREKVLSHRDFLGSIVGLGIKREKIGDILVGDDFAYVILDEGVKDFIAGNLDKVGRQRVTISESSLQEMLIIKPKYIVGKDTVASLRADNIISGMFNITRSEAVEGIRRGLVFCNNLEVSKSDKQIRKGDKISFRGKGKSVLIDIGDKSRKGRTHITFHRYGR